MEDVQSCHAERFVKMVSKQINLGVVGVSAEMSLFIPALNLSVDRVTMVMNTAKTDVLRANAFLIHVR